MFLVQMHSLSYTITLIPVSAVLQQTEYTSVTYWKDSKLIPSQNDIWDVPLRYLGGINVVSVDEELKTYWSLN